MPDSDYPLSEIPIGTRKSLFSTSIMLFSFTFFTATMSAGGKIGMTFDFTTLTWAAIITTYDFAQAQQPDRSRQYVLESGAQRRRLAPLAGADVNAGSQHSPRTETCPWPRNA